MVLNYASHSEDFQSLKTIKIMKFSVKDAEVSGFFIPRKFGSWIQKPLITKIMRVCVVPIILLATSFQLFAATPVKSQSIDQTIVNIDLKNAQLIEAFKKIEEQSNFHFAYLKKDVKDITNLNLTEHDESVADVLKALLANTSLSFKQKDRQILIQAKTADAQTATNNPTDPNTAALPKVSIYGKVLDGKGQPLPGVTVSEKGTTNVSVTDINGSYRISVTDKKSVLTFRYVGYESQSVEVGNQVTINVTLTEINSDLNEVVVVGYGTQKKASVTGAIASVKGSDLAQAPVDNITNSLAGRVSGVIARQTGGGQPGNDNTTFSIRGVNTTGNNAPLIVVDGITRNNLNQIDPNSIESVTILKDAAAVAPYGLGGANGVVLITTKTGKIGAPILSINTYYGTQTPTYYPKVLNAIDYMKLRDEAATNEGVLPANLPFAQTLIDNYPTLTAQDPNKYPTSSAKRLINMHAPEQSYNVQLSGGSDRIKYYTDLGFFNQAGEFTPVSYTRYAYTMGLEAKVTNTTTLSLSIKGSYEITTSVDPGTSTSTLFRDTYKLIPTDPLEFSNGLAGSSSGLSLLGALRSQGYSHNYNNTTLSTIAIDQKLPLKGLSIKGTFSYDPNSNNVKNWHTPFYYYAINTAVQPYTYTQQIATAEGPPAYTYLAQSNSRTNNFTYQGYLNYHNTFGKHDVTGLVVAEARNGATSSFNAQINNYALNVDEFNFGSSNKNDYTIGGTSSTSSSVGYVYRVGDNFDNKYLLEASGRYDGSYFFAPGKQYAFFPAFSAGWIMSSENFMKGLTFVDYLKLRGSWGKSGMLAGSAFQFVNAYNLASNAYAYGNSVLVQGTSATNQANPNITWEQAIKTDIGLDGTLFKGLLTFEVDVYKQLRSGMLYTPSVSVPTEYGIGLSQINGAAMQGQGIEFTLGTQHRFANGINIGATGTFSYNTNKLTQIYETSSTYNNPNRRQTGRPFGEQFGYHALGLFTLADDKNHDGVINAADGYNVTQFGTLHPGDIKYQDVNGDGKIDANDQLPIGNSNTPLIDYGLNLTASWKGFDVAVLLQGAAKSTMGTLTFVTVPFANNNSNAGYEYYNNHWSPSNPGGKYPIANQAPTSNNTQASDFWETSGAYLRVKTVQIGYTIPTSIVRALKIKSVRFYAAGQNLFTISGLKFIDPEIGNPVSGTSGIGGAGSSPETLYPIQRVMTLGLNATF
jgi:TonB-linked SusC/RagA family outer membrane protein